MMRKKTINQATESPSSTTEDKVEAWLDLEQLAQVEITSESETNPIESALTPDPEAGWLAGQPGEQIIRLVFDKPQPIRRIHIEFSETDYARTQEFVLSWLPEKGETFREIVRQQYNFSPPGNTQEIEDYTVELDEMKTLELRIVPDISGGDSLASLAQLRLA
jgi:hypothetical protein